MKIMSKLQNRKEELKKDNKGFSLVELIIVIAIMAILVGVVGTQVIPYIDKSRNAKDIQILSALCTDGMTAYSSNAATLDPAKTYTITISTSGSDISVTSTGTEVADELDALKDSFKELNSYVKVGDLKLASKAGKEVDSITITCKNTDPMIEVEAKAKSSAKAKPFEKIQSNGGGTTTTTTPAD